MKIIFPHLYTWQQEVFDWFGDGYKSGKQACIKSFRQGSGKTFLCSVLLLKMALEHSNTTSVVIHPTLAQSRKMFNDIVKSLSGSNLINANGTLLYIKFVNGSEIYFKSAEQKDGIRGFTVTGWLIYDETAFIDDDYIYTSLPLSAVHKAPTLFISTPMFSEGFFYEAYNNPNIKSFDWSKYLNECFSEEQLNFYKSIYSKNKFRSEILGEFITTDGLLFNNIQECVGKPSKYNWLYCGIDFATGNNGDYTSISFLNENKEMTELQYKNNISPSEQIDWLANIINSKSNIKTILAEVNSIGSVYIDLIKKKIKYPITNWITSNKSKQDIITNLQMHLDNKQITLLDDPKLLRELKTYEAVINPKTGNVFYNASKGNNDDTVISTALALKAITSSYGKYVLTF